MQDKPDSGGSYRRQRASGRGGLGGVDSLGRQIMAAASFGRDTSQWVTLAGLAAVALVVVVVGVLLVRSLTRPKAAPVPAATLVQALASTATGTPMSATPTEEPTLQVATTVPPTEEPLQKATAAPTATAVPSPSATPGTPTVAPTPDLNAQIHAAVEEYTRVRAAAEAKLDPALLAQVCVEPYLSWKQANIQGNIRAGSHWETRAVAFTVTSVSLLDPDTADVWVNKTETKVYIPAGSSIPDDETCLGNILSYRNCTYDAHYTMVRREGRWYVSAAEAPGANCPNQCQQ